MGERLWAPWRLSYVTQARPDGCVFCARPAAGDDEDALIVARGDTCFVVLNLYPYNPGHLMVIPYRHVADLAELTPAESAEAQVLIVQALEVLRSEMSPGGFNVGLNLGDAAGAGIAAHMHWHVVPRWEGDTNFMPVLAETKVMPQHLATTWQAVRGGFATRRSHADPHGDADA